MRPAGEYTVLATYRGITEETTFEYAGSGVETWREFTVDIGGNDYVIRYQISGGSLQDITADVALSSLTVMISSTADGELKIELPRSTIQALSVPDVATGGSDVDYTVFVDTIPDDTFDEEKTSTARTLTIPFEAGAEEIEIVGTWVIPEFGAIAAIVLAVAIVGIIVATARYGKFNNFAPRL
jgi:predicted secreted protein with PEFG-CTERM motif